MMRNTCNYVTLLLIFFSFYISIVQATNSQGKPAIQQGISYKEVDDISLYWLSEKLDGMRGYWTGKQLISRQGHLIFTPTWFTKNWPDTPIDGELWLARNSFEQTMSCVRKKTPDDNCWQKIKFMIFDLPKSPGSFTQRIEKMRQLSQPFNKQKGSPYLKMIEQFKVTSIAALYNKLDEISKINGEGLMLHLASAPYFTGRNAYVMKLKKYQDDEAQVIAHLPGKGKYKNMLGALLVATPKGLHFKIGSGFTDNERRKPPKIGSIITYQYNGKTQKGLPRFARFLRVRFPKSNSPSPTKPAVNKITSSKVAIN